MNRALTALLMFLVVAGFACSREHAPPSEPPPDDGLLLTPTVEIGTVSKESDGIRLSITLYAVGKEEVTGLLVRGTVENVGPDPIAYDAGGCGCWEPWNGVASDVPTWGHPIWPLCPCWMEMTELPPGESISRSDLFSRCCGAGGPGEARTTFGYLPPGTDAWKSIAVSMPVAAPDSLLWGLDLSSR